MGPRGVQVLADLGLGVPDAGQGRDLLAVGPSGRRSRLPAFTGRTYPGHGIIVPRLALDHALRGAVLQAGAVPVRARVTAVEAGGGGRVDAVASSDGRRLAGEVIIAAGGALSPVARLAGMLDPDTALWGFAIRAYAPAEVPLPLLVLLDASPWRIYPGGYGWLFPGADGQANVGIGAGLGSERGQAPLRGDLARAGLAYAGTIEATFGQYMAGASALQSALLGRPRTASAAMRVLTAPVYGALSRAPGRFTGTGWPTAPAPAPPPGPRAPCSPGRPPRRAAIATGPVRWRAPRTPIPWSDLEAVHDVHFLPLDHRPGLLLWRMSPADLARTFLSLPILTSLC